MRKLIAIFILINAGVLLLAAQNSPALIENIRVQMENKSMVVRYDISGSPEGSPHLVDFVVIDNMGNVVLPDSVSGDVGPGIPAGSDKVIIWEINKEYDVVYGNFTPRLTIDAGENRKKMRGPEYAALSLLVPGLGDYFVTDIKEMKVKPYHKSAFTVGVLGLAWATYRNREEIPPVMMPPGYYQSGESPEPYIYIDHEWMKEPATTKPWLFPYDTEILLGIGIASWLFDVIWVARRGVENRKIEKSLLGNVSLIPGHQGVLLSYRIQF